MGVKYREFPFPYLLERHDRVIPTERRRPSDFNGYRT